LYCIALLCFDAIQRKLSCLFVKCSMIYAV
jgi:hypothetical protein